MEKSTLQPQKLIVRDHASYGGHAGTRDKRRRISPIVRLSMACVPSQFW